MLSASSDKRMLPLFASLTRLWRRKCIGNGGYVNTGGVVPTVGQEVAVAAGPLAGTGPRTDRLPDGLVHCTGRAETGTGTCPGNVADGDAIAAADQVAAGLGRKGRHTGAAGSDGGGDANRILSGADRRDRCGIGVREVDGAAAEIQYGPGEDCSVNRQVGSYCRRLSGCIKQHHYYYNGEEYLSG